MFTKVCNACPLFYSVQGLSCPGFVLSSVCRVQGLSVQGLSVQGLSVQGLSVQGLSVQGLSVYRFIAVYKCN
jgi:hypothetical protein